MNQSNQIVGYDQKFVRDDFPEQFSKLWDELVEILKSHMAGNSNYFHCAILFDDVEKCNIKQFAINFTKSVHHDMNIEGAKEIVGDTIFELIELITENSRDDKSNFGLFCTLMNEVRRSFRDGAIKFRGSSLRDVCYFAWDLAK